MFNFFLTASRLRLLISLLLSPLKVLRAGWNQSKIKGEGKRQREEEKVKVSGSTEASNSNPPSLFLELTGADSQVYLRPVFSFLIAGGGA